MRIFTKVVLQWDESQAKYVTDFTNSEWYEYDGPVAECKGDASKTEQANADAQRNMENQLMQQQLNMQQQQLAGVNAAVDPTIASIMAGQTPGVLQPLQSALTASYMNQLPNTLQQGMGAINQNLTARGLTGGPNGAGGGAVAGNFGQLTAMLGALQQQGATNTAQTMSQANLGLLQNDLGLKLGIANQYGGNVGGFNQGASAALGSGVTAANNVDQAQTSWMGPAFGALGALGAAGIGKIPGGGSKGCWIAAACFDGFNDPRVQFIRERLWQKASSDWIYRLIMSLYMVTGITVAKIVNKSSLVKRMFTKLFTNFMVNEFDVVLNEAVNG